MDNSFLNPNEQQLINSPNLQKTMSYDEMYKELYGSQTQQQNMNYNQYQNNANPYVAPTQISGYNQQLNNVNLMNAAAYAEVAPNQNAILDNVANLQYTKNNYSQPKANSSQFGLIDLDASDWFKYNLILLIPIFNTLFYFYYGFMKAFVKFPVLKEFSKSAIITSIGINILYLISIFMII